MENAARSNNIYARPVQRFLSPTQSNGRAAHNILYIGEQTAKQKSRNEANVGNGELKTPTHKHKCGPGQPPEPHRSWISQLVFPPLRAARRRYRSDSAHKERHIYQHWLRKRRFVESLFPHLLRRPAAQPVPRTRSRGGRNARATGSHSRAFPNFPWQFTLENCQSATSVTANHRSTSLKRSHVFAEPTLRQDVASRNTKTFQSCAEAVEDDSCLWKAEENAGENQASKMLVRECNNLYGVKKSPATNRRPRCFIQPTLVKTLRRRLGYLFRVRGGQRESRAGSMLPDILRTWPSVRDGA